MTKTDITTRQATKIYDALTPTLGFLTQLAGRLQELGLEPTDVYYQTPAEARQAFHCLTAQTHSLTRSRPDRRRGGFVTSVADTAPTAPLGYLCPDCHTRRHRLVVGWLARHGVTFTRVGLETPASCASCRAVLPDGSPAVAVGHPTAGNGAMPRDTAGGI